MDMLPAMDFGSMIRGARLEAGLTQSELAARSATSQATLSAYEHGRKVPSAATLQRILAASGHTLVVENGRRPVRTPSAAANARAARVLHDVLELAASLPSKPARKLRYPRLGPISPASPASA